MNWLSPETLLSFLTLSAMEIVLGVDNVVFIAILSERLPAAEQRRARRTGIALALVLRLALLFTLSWFMGLVAPIVTLFDHSYSGRDFVLLGGGLFLIAKAVHEIYDKVEADPEPGDAGAGRRGASFAGTVAQMLLLDLVFSLDSVITAVGMAQIVGVMVAAMVLAVAVMWLSADAVNAFIARHPSMRILALSFLLLIGVFLVADGLGQHIEKGYIYFSMGFAFLVELFNIRLRRARPLALHQRGEP